MFAKRITDIEINPMDILEIKTIQKLYITAEEPSAAFLKRKQTKEHET